MEVIPFEPDPEISQQVQSYSAEKLKAALQTDDKLAREEAMDKVKDETKEHFLELFPENEVDINSALESLLKEIVRKTILYDKVRSDGRSWPEIRPVSCEVKLFNRTHGSSLFTRGQTQVLNICTLGALSDMQRLDGLGIEETKRFMHHYNFPPYSVGETGFMRGAGRREIGHGSLAERALEPLVPDEEEFPYTIRLVSEVIESNGSSSMGSVCAGALSMMDAGVPLKAPVAGIAMGLVKEEDKVAILSDIQGIEDFLGDMDFKVAGTREGITALQMDIKSKGMSRDILFQSLKEAREGYLFILEKMEQTLSEPRPSLSEYAPRIITLHIDPLKIRDVIGPGGKVINKIIADTGVEMDIEPDGKVFIVALDMKAADKAVEMVKNLTADVEPGRTYMGKVTRTEKYGAFVEVLPGKEGLVHISQLENYRVDKTEDVVGVGDQVMVKVLDIDERGRINLSRKDALPTNSSEGQEKNGSLGAKGGSSPPRNRQKDFNEKHKPK